MTYEKVKAVNKILLDGEPNNISVDDYSGYTGYRPQCLIDAMNEIFWGAWGFEEIGSEILSSEKGQLAVAQVSVWLKDFPDFHPASYGQSRVTKGDVGDARKGAQTDAIKKALSYFSIGNRAYQGLLKEDSKASQNGKPNNRPPQNGNAPRPLSQNGNVPKSVLKWSDIYREGGAKGMWTQKDFYAIVSGMLNGIPVNGETIKSLTQEQLQKLHAEVAKHQVAQAS